MTQSELSKPQIFYSCKKRNLWRCPEEKELEIKYKYSSLLKNIHANIPHQNSTPIFELTKERTKHFCNKIINDKYFYIRWPLSTHYSYKSLHLSITKIRVINMEKYFITNIFATGRNMIQWIFNMYHLMLC